ncbi:acetyltransferase (GNAT) domain-containing protein [Hirsutella rhossiliensis]|uniref:Acetyltransferase (GNAT) domain-containing protein n=1 Tax=Hirsutella rhossiliensis TaxID=111463 RepID=A0A9P8MZE5_9HYPO|nr:acetyltransferase (GNAT) domain-containing protein [Hirsutella rhossiliensis]KAH0964044.1 acetyltransferase (GNAT) domain-containing protein [Hirsutella rhossiliensis]
MLVHNEDSRFVYQRATPAQITKHFENNSQMWAAPLSTSDYKDLHMHLSETEASIGQTAYWVLFDREAPETIISSCTTYLRDAMVNAGQGMRPVRAAVVTDIFTLPDYRRKGMATMLLSKVQQTLDEVVKRIEFSVLYSDLRPEFYGGLGWTPQPARHLRIVIGKALVEMPLETDELKYTRVPRLVELGKKDVNMAKLRLSGLRDDGNSKTHAQLMPTQRLMRWHIVRSGILKKKHLANRQTGEERPSLHGATSKNRETGTEAWVWWTHDLRSRRLYIGRLVSTRVRGMEREIKKVLGMAAAEASQLGFREVVVWEPAEQTVAAAALLVEELGQGARTVEEERPDMVPCLRWHGGEQREGGLVDAQFYGWS